MKAVSLTFLLHGCFDNTADVKGEISKPLNTCDCGLQAARGVRPWATSWERGSGWAWLWTTPVPVGRHVTFSFGS